VVFGSGSKWLFNYQRVGLAKIQGSKSRGLARRTKASMDQDENFQSSHQIPTSKIHAYS
jgi:hypothetical protein